MKLKLGQPVKRLGIGTVLRPLLLTFVRWKSQAARLQHPVYDILFDRLTSDNTEDDGKRRPWSYHNCIYIYIRTEIKTDSMK